MRKITINCVKQHRQLLVLPFNKQTIWRCYHGTPFIDLYQRTTGQSVSDHFVLKLKKHHPTIDTLSHDRLQCTLQILNKFGITPLDACHDVHVFTMNPITLDNYGEILKECGFIKILTKHIIRYHTLVRSRTIAYLKKQNLLREDLNLEKKIQDHILDWPVHENCLHNFPDSSTSILTVRMTVLQKYLQWRLLVTPDEFRKYCRNYLPLKHKPMSDIQESLKLAQNEIRFDLTTIRRNGFIISADPFNTKLIIENVQTVGGLDIREAIKLEPAILKNNYSALLQIRSILEEYRIPEEAQRKCLRVYCMCPKTVKERLNELINSKEYQVLKTNPRVLTMVVHKAKMMDRLEKIHAVKKQCFSLNHLVSSSKVFNTYISSFGNKVCGRDLAILIITSLHLNKEHYECKSDAELGRMIIKQLKRHKYWLHAALNVIDENIQFLKGRFSNKDIFHNCQLLLYPAADIEQYLKFLIKKRNGDDVTSESHNIKLDVNYNNLKYGALGDGQILSLVLYEIEKKYHFSGDGIWATQDGVKVAKSS